MTPTPMPRKNIERKDEAVSTEVDRNKGSYTFGISTRLPP
jgi:hypothetical protein